jgi:hypothetical protein
VNINGEWSDSENLIAGDSTDLGEDSDTILKIWIELGSTLLNWLVM